MTAEHIKIKNTALNSNTFVDFFATSFQPSYKKITVTKPRQGEVTPRYSLASGRNIGIEPPKFIIRGKLDVDGFDDDSQLWSETPSSLTGTFVDGVSRTNACTLGYLQALWANRGGQTIINIYFGNPSNQKRWKNYANDSYDIYVTIDAVNFIPAEDSDGLHFLDVEIQCTEVKPDG